MTGSLSLFLLIGLAVAAVILTGVPVALGIGALALAVSEFVVGPRTLSLIGNVAYGDVGKYTLIAVPLFILMSEVLAQANITDRAFDVISRRLKRLPASLAVSTNLLSTIFAAIIGSSAGNTAIMGRVALKPMLDRGYDPGLASGVIVAGGTIGVLIPPSTLMVLYAVATETSVGQLFIGGLIPGLLISFLMTLYILYRGLNGTAIVAVAPKAFVEPMERSSKAVEPPGLLADIGGLIPILLLLTAMTFSIYRGFATAAEIAAIGAVASISIGVTFRRLSPAAFGRSLMQTVRITSMILLIVVMAAYLARLLAFMSIGPTLVNAVEASGLGPMGVVFLALFFVLILGLFLDSAAIILVFGPLLHALMSSLGIDVLWWSIIFVIAVEIGLITPPFGINLFVLKGIAPYMRMGQIIRGAFPFVLILIGALLICVFVPEIVTYLPRSMIG